MNVKETGRGVVFNILMLSMGFDRVGVGERTGFEDCRFVDIEI